MYIYLFCIAQTFPWFKIQKVQIKISLISTVSSQLTSYQFEPKPFDGSCDIFATAVQGLKDTTPVQIQENLMQVLLQQRCYTASLHG